MVTVATPIEGRKARSKPERRMSIHGDPFGGGLVRLTVGDTAADYVTRMVPTSSGPFAVEYAKQGGPEVYHVTCTTANPQTAVIVCNCKGFTFHKHCKHADSAKALLLQLDA